MAEDHDEASRAFRSGVLSVSDGAYRSAVALEQIYRAGPVDPDFSYILDKLGAADDATLADLIESDGRLRLRLNMPVDLARYRDSIADLASRPDVLDAAIDVALRAIAKSGRPDNDSIESLIAEYPGFESPIREAALLNNALWSTASLRSELARTRPRELPCEFGPRISNGQSRYELVQLLGEGAFGQVFLAVDRQLSEDDHLALVAIKVLRGSDRSAGDRQRLIDEATKARRVEHPSVVRVLDRGISEENDDFIVYEYVEGGDLGKWVRRHRSRLDASEVVGLVSKIARGVHAAHMAGLVHCDLKPNNIMMTEDGLPKVADFGVAVREGEQPGSMAVGDRVGAPLGNLAFMSPEQYRMEPAALTIPSDVYALGGILYWLLTNELPNGATPEAIDRSHRQSSDKEPTSWLGGEVISSDRDLDAICRRALAVSADERYNSAASLAEDLEHWMNHEAIAWTKPSPLRRLRLWARRKPGLAVTTAVILLLVVISGGVVQFLATEAAVAQARSEAEGESREEFELRLQAFALDLQKSLREGEITHQLLPKLWLSEWLYGPNVLGKGAGTYELWKMRVDICRRLIAEAHEQDRFLDIDTLFWEEALGFWLLQSGEAMEAAEILATNRRHWMQALARKDDPWLADLKAMEVCAQVDLRLSRDPKDRAAASDDEDLGTLAAFLDQTEARVHKSDYGSPIHMLVLTYQVKVYGPAGLNDPEKVNAAQQEIDGMRE